MSDGLLGYNKFGGTLPYAQIAVMMTYMVAQYLIVTGEVLGTMRKPKIVTETDSTFGRHKVK